MRYVIHPANTVPTKHDVINSDKKFPDVSDRNMKTIYVYTQKSEAAVPFS